ncbi:MAG: DNA-binding protein [Verrucomicrobiota bacterium]
MKVFLDANILFSGSLRGARMCHLIKILLTRAHCLTNGYAVEEARRNLALKFPESLPQLESLLAKCAMVPASSVELEAMVKSKDMPILGGAVSGKASYLLTGDERDFGHLFGKTVQNVTVVSPRMLAEEMVRLGWIECADR